MATFQHLMEGDQISTSQGHLLFVLHGKYIDILQPSWCDSVELCTLNQTSLHVAKWEVNSLEYKVTFSP